MKVLHVNAGNETGGGKSHIIGLLSQFDSTEAALLVFEDGPVAEAAREAGIKLYIIEKKNKLDFSIFKKIISLVKKENFDIIHTHGPRANLFVRFVKSKLNVIWLTTIHSNPKFDFINQGIKGFIFTKLNIWTYKKIDYFLLITKDFEESLKELSVPENKLKPIFNAIEFLEEDLVNRKPLEHNSKKEFTLINVARLQPVKNQKLLLNALGELSSMKFKLLIVGDGPLEEELRALVEQLKLTKKVEFLGFRADAAKLYSLANISILTSISEGFPTVLLESANYKTPAIATNVGSVNEIIPSSEIGWVVENESKEELKKSIQEAFLDFNSDKLAEKGNLFYNYSKENFSMNALGKEIKEIYQDQLNKDNKL